MNSHWTPSTIASIVEGHGEIEALPKILHRIADELSVATLITPTPQRVPRGKLTIPGGIERWVATTAPRVQARGGVLVLVDADDDCPAQLGPELAGRARSGWTDKRIAVILANREFEAWFLAAAPSIAGQCGFSRELARPENSESPRDCKGILTRARPPGRPYKEVVDQVSLASIFDMSMAREHSDSFDKFYRDVAWLLEA